MIVRKHSRVHARTHVRMQYLQTCECVRVLKIAVCVHIVRVFMQLVKNSNDNIIFAHAFGRRVRKRVACPRVLLHDGGCFDEPLGFN